MEREAVRQEQRNLPWPFAPPHSPQRSVYSQFSHSLSVGSSPSRAPPRVAPPSSPGGSRDQSPRSPLIDRCRARRTSQQGLAAKCSLYSRHLDSRAVGLLDRHSTGLRAVGDQSYTLGYTDTCRLANIHSEQNRTQPVLRPPLSTSTKNSISSQVSLDTDSESCGSEEEMKKLDSSQHPAGGNQRPLLKKNDGDEDRDLSWVVGVNCYTAQWVKQKQAYRSTRPW